MKICKLCGEDCSSRPRVKDAAGSYYCKSCHAAALKARDDRELQQDATTPAESDEAYSLMDEIIAESTSTAATEPAAPANSITCPSCGADLAEGSAICTSCGINLKSGRSTIVRRGVDENVVYHNAERTLRPLSWLIGSGFSPVASDAPGTRKPYATWVIAAMTIVISFWFWFSTDSQLASRKNLLLWTGDEPTAAHILTLYQQAPWGDYGAFNREMMRASSSTTAGSRLDERTVVAIHDALPSRSQVIADFAFYQLVTHAFLHGDLLHLLGNLVFLLIFGSRVNALVGNIATTILYPLLAVLAGWGHMISTMNAEPLPMLGASGAIMGMAGMYLVLFPLNRMHLAAWIRVLFYFRMKIWLMRGFWVVLLYIAFDAFFVLLRSDDGVAHWAHLGGFIAGILLALGLLCTRMLYAGGTDVISAVLGRRAWAILGPPGEHKQLGFSLPLGAAEEAAP